MKRMRSLGFALASVLLAACLDVGPLDQELRVATLIGENMRPNPQPIMRGDQPSTATLLMAVEGGQVRWDLQLNNVEAATLLTLHFGGDEDISPVAVTMYENSAGVTGDIIISGGRILTADLAPGVTMAQVVAALREPHAYAQLATLEFPDGALRGRVSPLAVGF